MTAFFSKPIDSELATQKLSELSIAGGVTPQVTSVLNEPESQELPGFDKNRVEELIELLGSREELMQIIQMMYTDSIGIVEEMHALIAAQSIAIAMQKMHSLKGAAGGVGASAVERAAKAIEAQLREGKDCTAELLQLRHAWSEIAEVVSR